MAIPSFPWSSPLCSTRISKVGKCEAFQLWTPTYFICDLKKNTDRTCTFIRYFGVQTFVLFTWNCIRFSNWQVTCMFYLLRREIAFTLNILLSYFPFLTYFLKEVFHGSCNPALAFYCRDFSASRGEEKKIFSQNFLLKKRSQPENFLWRRIP